MTTSIDERRRAVVAHERRATRSVAEYFTGGTWHIGLWYWVISAIVVIVLVVVQAKNPGVEISIGTGPAGSTRFFLMVMAILLPLMITHVHLAAGGTRRTLTRGLISGAVVVGVTFGAVATLLGLIQPIAVEFIGGEAAASTPAVLPLLSAQIALCTGYTLAGSALSLGYDRLGGWLGTLFIFPLFGPLILAEYVTGAGLAFLGAGVPVWVAVVGCVVAIIAEAYLLWVFARGLSVRPAAV